MELATEGSLLAEFGEARRLYELPCVAKFFKAAWEHFPDYNCDQSADAADAILTDLEQWLEAEKLPPMAQGVMDLVYEEIMAGLT